MEKISILVYKALKKKRKKDFFDGNDNIGALVIRRCLEAAGFLVDYCTPDTADRCRVVLVSLTSTFDVYAFYRQVALLPQWQPGKRKFKIVAGGFGMQNPWPIRHYVDYAVFGRAESFVSEVVTAAVDAKKYPHPSVINLPEVTGVKIAQAAQLLPFGVTYNTTKTDRESFVGCPNKCKFCHYTWARRSLGHTGVYVNEHLSGASSPEMTWKHLLTTTGKLGRVRSAIDGLSERLRFLYGKKITNQDIIAGIHRLGGYGGTTVCTLYNISNMPGETQEDLREFAAVVAKAKPDSRVILVLHSTPFRPSLATPMQWEAVSLFPNWHNYAAQVVFDSPKLRVVHSTGNESPYSHLMCVVAERSSSDTDNLFHNICFNPRLRTGGSVKLTRTILHHFATDQYLRRYNIGDPNFPGWFLRGWADVTGVAGKMRKNQTRKHMRV